MTVERFELRIAMIRMIGDRGPAFDPHADGIGEVSIHDTALELDVGDVPPALYSAAELTLAPDADTPALLLQVLVESGPRVALETFTPLTLNARCEHGAAVSTTGTVRVAIDLGIAAAAETALGLPLPAAGPDGIVHVNETTAPASIDAFRAAIVDHVQAECGPDSM